MRLKTVFHVILLSFVMLPLGGCETMEQTMATVKQKVSSIQMPSFSTKDDTTVPAEPGAEMAAVSNGANPMAAAAQDCPAIEVLPELNVMHQFIDAKSHRAEDRLSTLKMAGFTSQCKRNESNIIVDLDIRFEGTLGPKASAWNTDRPSFAYPYFVAVATPNGNIMAKEVFGVTVSYSQGQTSIIHTEHIHQIIPAMGEMGGESQILMGFQLTEAELAFNRSMIADMPLSGASEAALSQKNPALVYEGDPALEPAKPAAPKKKKMARPPKPQMKPATASATAPAPEPASAPASAAPDATTPATAPATEPVPAAAPSMPAPADSASPVTEPATVPGTDVPTPGQPATAAPATTGQAPAAASPAEEEETAPPAVEMLDDGTGSMDPPPYNPPSDITAPQ